MATVTQVQEATNAEGQPIKLAVAYVDQVHETVRTNKGLLSWPKYSRIVVEVPSLSPCIRHYNEVPTDRALRFRGPWPPR